MATTIRVAAAQRPPYVFVNNQLSGPAAYSGLLVQLLPVLLQTANITAPFARCTRLRTMKVAATPAEHTQVWLVSASKVRGRYPHTAEVSEPPQECWPS